MSTPDSGVSGFFDEALKGLEALSPFSAVGNALDWTAEAARALKSMGTVFLYLLNPNTYVRFILLNLGFASIGVGIALFIKG